MGSYPPTPPPHEHEIVHGSPEVLPPGTGTFTSPPPARRRRPGWAASPATYFLVGINCAVYIAMVCKGVSAVSPTHRSTDALGRQQCWLRADWRQWWRIVSAMFVHAGFLHLATNMWCLWNLGLLAEPLMGSWGVLAVYILTGAAAICFPPAKDGGRFNRHGKPTMRPAEWTPAQSFQPGLEPRGRSLESPAR